MLEQSRENPAYLPYRISLSRKRPGLLRMTYCRRATVFHEYAELRPVGILYDEKVFRHAESFVNYVKANLKRIVGLPRE